MKKGSYDADAYPGERIAYSENEERSMDIDYVPPERPRRVSGMLRFGMYGFAAFSLLSVLFSGETGLSSDWGYSALQLGLICVFAAIFAELCAGLAAKIGRNLDFAWALGFLFGFTGLIVYWVYSRIAASKASKAETKDQRKPQAVIVEKKKRAGDGVLKRRK